MHAVSHDLVLAALTDDSQVTGRIDVGDVKPVDVKVITHHCDPIIFSSSTGDFGFPPNVRNKADASASLAADTDIRCFRVSPSSNIHNGPGASPVPRGGNFAHGDD